MNPLEEVARQLASRLDLSYQQSTSRGRAAGMATANDLAVTYTREKDGEEYLQVKRPGLTIHTIYSDGSIASSVIRGAPGKEEVLDRYTYREPAEAATTIADIIRPKPT